KRLCAVRGEVAVPHEFGLRAVGQRIVNESAKTVCSIRSQIVYSHSDGLRIQRIGATGFVSHKRREFPLVGSVLPVGGSSTKGKNESCNSPDCSKWHMDSPI